MVDSIADQAELRDKVYAATSYDNSPDELPQSQLDTIIDTVQMRLSIEADSEQWYSDKGLSLALLGYTCMRAKASMENIPLQSYTLGDETVSFDTDDPEDSVQLQQWAEDIATGLAHFESQSGNARVPRNTAGYIGETSVRE